MKFSIKDFFRKCDQTRSFLRISPHLLKKSLMENVIFCAETDGWCFLVNKTSEHFYIILVCDFENHDPGKYDIQ